MLSSSPPKSRALREAEPVLAGSAAVARRRIGLALEPYLYLLPALIVFGLFFGLPLLGTIGLSLTDWDGYGTPSFTGLGNYAKAVTDQQFWLAAKHNLILVPYYVILPAVLGLVPAALVQQLKLRGSAVFRVGLFLPVFGPVNAILKFAHLPQPTWLGDFTLALPTVGLIGAWAAYGFCYVVFLAGMQKIPAELYEAARLDGASALGEFRIVTLPGLRREMAVVLSVNVINALRAFDVIWATTRGGPGHETSVLALYMVERAFNVNQVGYGAAIAVVLAVLTLVVSLATLRLAGALDD